jgi:hypothetical protein
MGVGIVGFVAGILKKKSDRTHDAIAFYKPIHSARNIQT